jgi:hypothetical protein
LPPEAKIKTNEFLHDSSVNRDEAKQILSYYKNEHGVYLVRRTLRDENILVLSLMFNNEFFNYEICIKDLNIKYYFIDDGPYFRSLSHLIEHYMKYEDGLPGLLTKPIPPTSFSQNDLFISNQMPVPAQRLMNPTQFKSSNNMNNNNKLNSVSTINMNNGQTLMNISNQMSQSQAFINNGMNNNNNNIQAKSDALTKANLFKSRTLLNDQSNFIKHIKFKL